MKILAIILAVVCFAVAACYFFHIGFTYQPKHAALYAGIGILSLVWLRFQKLAGTARKRP